MSMTLNIEIFIIAFLGGLKKISIFVLTKWL